MVCRLAAVCCSLRNRNLVALSHREPAAPTPASKLRPRLPQLRLKFQRRLLQRNQARLKPRQKFPRKLQFRHRNRMRPQLLQLNRPQQPPRPPQPPYRRPQPQADQAPSPAATTINPAIVTQILPDIVPSALKTINGTLRVSVALTVGADGLVTGATLQSAGTEQIFLRQIARSRPPLEVQARASARQLDFGISIHAERNPRRSRSKPRSRLWSLSPPLSRLLLPFSQRMLARRRRNRVQVRFSLCQLHQEFLAENGACPSSACSRACKCRRTAAAALSPCRPEYAGRISS